MITIRCTFRPQAWQNNYAIPVDAQGETEWEMEVEQLPDPYSYDSDRLREDANAPEWVQAWSGPFEVDYVCV